MPVSAPLLSLFGKNSNAHAGKRERRKQARPGELLDAALALFVEKGFAATRVEAVAARAGVSKGTLFLYFPSKDELFKAVVRENISGRFKIWNEEFDTFSGSTAQMLNHCMTVWWDRVGATAASGITKLMLSEAQNFPQLAAFYREEVTAPGYALVRRILQRGIDSGEFRPMNLDYTVYSVISPMIFLILAKHSASVCLPSEQPLPAHQFIAAQLCVVLDGMRSTRPTTGAPT